MAGDTDRGSSGALFMFISAALFGYFGFTRSWTYHSAITGDLLVYVPMLEWTLKASAVVFAAAGVISLFAPSVGNIIYCVTGVLGAIMFIVVAVMDLADTQHQVMSPLLLIIFAAWNGMNSWGGMKKRMKDEG